MKKRLLATAVLSLSMFVLTLAQASQTKAPSAGAAQKVEVTRGGSQSSQKGPAENFTGSVRIDPLFPARAWHTHPAADPYRDSRVGPGPAVWRPSPGDQAG